MVLDYDTARHRPLPSDALKSCQDLMTDPYFISRRVGVFDRP